MADELNFLPELIAEKESLDPSFVHCMRLLDREIVRLQHLLENPQPEPMPGNDFNGGLHSEISEPHQGSEPPNHGLDGRPHRGHPKMFRRPNEMQFEQVSKLSEKVMVPVKDFPKFNFVGKILGPRGNTLKRLQAQTGTKMSVLGRGSMRDREKEEELRKAGEEKYQHLNDPLHVLIEVEASQSESHLRLAAAISELKKHMSPENDDIRQQQMQEMAYLQSIDNPDAMPQMAQHVQQVQEVQVAPPQMARGRARPMFQGMARGAPAIRGIPMQRGGRITKTLIARSPGGPGGMPRMPGGMMAPRHAAQAPDPFKSFSISQMAVPHMVYGAAFSDATYDAAYETGFQEAPNEEVYYDYAPGETVNFAPPPSSSNYTTAAAFKTPVRQLKRSVRESAFPY